MENGWTRHGGNEVYYTCDLLSAAGARHLFSTRIGGVSKGCFASWNFANGIGTQIDSDQNVLANYELAANLFGLHKQDVCRSYQEHTAKVLTVTDEHRGIGTVKPKFPFGVDGLVSKTKDLLLSVRSADCVPILLFDPNASICAAVHAGWRGTAADIVGNAVREMQTLGSDPKAVLAAIGPCIGSCCYEVGRDVFDAFVSCDEGLRSCLQPKENGKYMLSVAEGNVFLLKRAGLTAEHISVCGLCTYCNENEFFSHRRIGADRGTMSAFITV